MKNVKIFAALAIPAKGSYKPNRIGCLKADFIKTKMPDDLPDTWIAHGRLYEIDDKDEAREFSEMCKAVTPAEYQQRMMAFPIIMTVAEEMETRPCAVPDLPTYEEEPVTP